MIDIKENINKIITGDCLSGLKLLPDNSIDCCVTSPPYFNLRDYGNKMQIGLEDTPEKFIQSLVNVFTEVKRVLKDEGTVWVVIGDSYNGSNKAKETKNFNKVQTSNKHAANVRKTEVENLKPKDLIGIPWMFAFALREAGYYLRQDIIWHKPNPMPESVRDRCTKAHEYIFLFSKSKKYYFDVDAIKTNTKAKNLHDKTTRPSKKFLSASNKVNAIRKGGKVYEKVHKRSVWSINTKGFKDAHFAVFPEDLIKDCIKAGCPVSGIVLDPFMGAGTTALVARKLCRNFIGYELNPDYVRIAEKRLFNSLGIYK